MNKYTEIIRMCIEQIEKDEEEAKKKVKIMLNSRYGVMQQQNAPINAQEIDFILTYIDTLLSILHAHPTYNVIELLEVVRTLFANLKE